MSTLSRRGMIVGGKKRGHGLPKEYQEVEYLESKGNGYALIGAGIYDSYILPASGEFTLVKTGGYLVLYNTSGSTWGSFCTNIAIQESQFQSTYTNRSNLRAYFPFSQIGLDIYQDKVNFSHNHNSATIGDCKRTYTNYGTWNVQFGFRYFYNSFCKIYMIHGAYFPCYRKTDNKAGFATKGGDFVEWVGDYELGANV